jgi:hypothetical protein
MKHTAASAENAHTSRSRTVMERSVFEGSWEDLAKHSDEFAGKRLRLIVLGMPAGQPLDRALSGLLEAAERLREEGTQPALPAPPPSWVDDVAEKFRRQGFRLRRFATRGPCSH